MSCFDKRMSCYCRKNNDSPSHFSSFEMSLCFNVLTLISAMNVLRPGFRLQLKHILRFQPVCLLLLCFRRLDDFISLLVVILVMIFLISGGTTSGAIMCTKHRMEDPTFWLAVVGFLIIAYALMKNIKGAMIYGIVFVTGVSWFRHTKVNLSTPSSHLLTLENIA